jgi:hypothetical protein
MIIPGHRSSYNSPLLANAWPADYSSSQPSPNSDCEGGRMQNVRLGCIICPGPCLVAGPGRRLLDLLAASGVARPGHAGLSGVFEF